MRSSRVRRHRFGHQGPESLEVRHLMSTISVTSSVGWPEAPSIEVIHPFRKAFNVSTGSQANVLEVELADRPSAEFELLSVQAAKHGVVTIDGQDQLVYTPDANFEGRDQFWYEIEIDDRVRRVNTTVDVIHPFVAVPDWNYVQTGNEVQLDVLVNDRWNDTAIDSEEPPQLTIESVSLCKQYGDLRISEDGQSVIYTPKAGFVGLDEFQYTAIDEHNNRGTARVQVRVGDEPYDPTTASTFRWEEEYVHYKISAELDKPLEQRTRFPLYDFDLGFNVQSSSTWWTGASAGNLGTVVRSDTNVQVEGVDEADLIENDGEYIYWISQVNADLELNGNDQRLSLPGERLEFEYELVILSAASPEESGVLSKVRFTDRPIAMFLYAERLTVITESFENGVGVTVLDVSNREQPTVVETNRVSGRFDDARMIDGRLYLFTNRIMDHFDSGPIFLRTFVDCFNCNSWLAPTQTEQHRLEQLLNRQWLPEIVSQTGEGTLFRRALVDVRTIQRDSVDPELNSAVFVFDTTDDAAGTSSEVMLDFDPEAIYMDHDSVYLTSSVTKYMSNWGIGPTAKTEIFAYEITDGGLDLRPIASGLVPGTIANQFAMDEYNGQLRVATNYRGGSSAVYVLEANGDRLQIVGGLAGLAPGQLLYSARFVGDRAYLVTFQKVDPLHVIDLSDSSNPVELGQLVIPGFSDYLHPISENLILGLGRHVERGLFQELQVSLFDVSDPFHPKRIHNYLIDGGRSTRFLGKGNPWGIGDLDHHSFSYFDDSGILALPLYSVHAGSFWGAGNAQTRNAPIYQGNDSGVHLLRIDAEMGIQLESEITFDDRVKRSIKIGDTVYALSDTTVKAVSLSDPTEVITEFSVLDGGPAPLRVSMPHEEVPICEAPVIVSDPVEPAGEPSVDSESVDYLLAFSPLEVLGDKESTEEDEPVDKSLATLAMIPAPNAPKLPPGESS